MSVTKSNPIFFKSAKELRQWLAKNYRKEKEVWVGFYRKGFDKSALAYKDAYDQILCFGWTISIIKNIDTYTYKALFLKRKPKSKWSFGTLKKFEALKKKGLVHKGGLEAFADRDKKGSETKRATFTPAQLKKIKSNKKAWEFFSQQTESYRHYMAHWVNNAVQNETKEKRLKELINDSAEGSKLKRIVAAAAKIKKVYPPGKTPIEEAKNVGITTGAELRSIGVETVEQLKAQGWEKIFYRLIESYPHRINLNMLTGLIGAVEDQHWQNIDPDLKAEAKAIIKELKTGSFR
jgi:uncharacterized protein YdeI (YjbR/CyaY-like superfamily)